MGTRNDLRLTTDGVLYCNIVDESLNCATINDFPLTIDYNVTCPVVEDPTLTVPCKYVASERVLYIKSLIE